MLPAQANASMARERVNMATKLDLGCGPFGKLEGAVGLDINDAAHVDVVHSLDDYPYPFDDAQFDHVEMSHILEHILQPARAMDEVYRIARPGASIRIVTPHYSSQLSYGDLTHYHHFGYVTITQLCRDGRFRMDECRLIFSDVYRVLGISLLANWFPRRWEKYLAFIFPGMYVEAKLTVVKP